jgi:hypothetical protein
LELKSINFLSQELSTKDELQSIPLSEMEAFKMPLTGPAVFDDQKEKKIVRFDY